MKLKLAPWVLKLAYKVVDVESLGESSVYEGRTLEYGFAISKLAKLTPGKLLDIGCTARINPIPSTFCNLGWEVTGLDIRDYNYAHKNFIFKRESLFEQPTQANLAYDAITCISTLEHLGLRRYGNELLNRLGDLEALAIISKILKPEGKLILTVPYTKGSIKITNLERIYGSEEIEKFKDYLHLEEQEEHPNLLLTSWSRYL